MAKDYVTPIAIIGGLGLAAAGLYYYSRKPPGVDPGGTVFTTVTFAYTGAPIAVVVQVSFGRVLVGPLFEHYDSMIWVEPYYIALGGSHEVKVACKLPDDPPSVLGGYDAEILIRTPDMPQFTYLPGGKLVDKQVVNLRS